MDTTIIKLLQDNEMLQKQNNELQKQNEALKLELEKVNEHLKKYTAPNRRKKYYGAHKEEIIKKAVEYNKNHKRSKEKMQEYNKRAYLRRKETDNKLLII
jgi:hypothetical protein